MKRSPLRDALGYLTGLALAIVAFHLWWYGILALIDVSVTP